MSVTPATAATSRPGAAHLAHWPRGVARDFWAPDVTLGHYLDVAADRFPHKPAILYCGSVLRYQALRRRVDALAGWLQQRLGVGPGDRVLLVSQNCPQFVVAFQAILRAGAVVVPVNPMSKAAEIAHFASDSGATVAFAAQEVLPELSLGDSPGALRAVVVHAYGEAIDAASSASALPDGLAAPLAALGDPRLHGFEAAVAAGLPHTPVPQDPDALAVLPYTSGTTGRPKGCMHTHRTVLASLIASQGWRGLTPDTTVLTVAPLFHMLGLQNGMNMPLTLGGTSVMMPRWNAGLAARLIEQHRVTVWAAPPAMVIDFFNHPEVGTRDLSSLALLSGGGAAMPEAVAAMLQERYGLAYNEAYGLTETASFLHANPVLRGKRQCLGVPTQGVDSRIVDPQTLEELPQGEVGELVTRGCQVMQGYWRNPQADRESFIEIDGLRFFRTGDLASVDAEGYFFLRDRLKRMINASGYKVWPAEVESLMYQHPAIHEACIVAVPDARQGESVRALVVLKPEARGRVSEQEIMDWSRERMAVYKAPRSVEFLDVLPKSGTGKILWRELQEARAQAPLTTAPASAPTSAPMAQDIPQAPPRPTA